MVNCGTTVKTWSMWPFCHSLDIFSNLRSRHMDGGGDAVKALEKFGICVCTCIAALSLTIAGFQVI